MILLKIIGLYEIKKKNELEKMTHRNSTKTKHSLHNNFPKELLVRIFKQHQIIKSEFFDEYGNSKMDDNGFTLDWLEKRDNSKISSMLNDLQDFIRKNDDLQTNYLILKELYGISPSLHENWFFDKHLKNCLKNIVCHRSGLKTYQTSKRIER